MKTSRIVIYGVLLVVGLGVLAVTRQRPPVEVEPATAVMALQARPLKPLTPRLVVDKLEILADLRASRFEALESKLAAYQRKAESEIAEEANVRLAFQAFENGDPMLADLLSEWVRRSPKSYASHMARATYLFQQGWRTRGAKYASETSADSFAGMQSLFAQGTEEANAALALNRKLVPAHAVLIQGERAFGGAEACMRLGEQALAEVPASFVIRSEIMSCLEPKWGGSIEAIDAFAQESVKHISLNPRLAVFKGFSDYERGASIHMMNRDYTAAVQSITKAINDGGDYSRFYSGRADAFSHLGRPKDALADFERANELWPQSQGILESIAREQATLGRYQESLETLDLSTKIGGPSSHAQELRAFVMQRIPQSGGAKSVGGD